MTREQRLLPRPVSSCYCLSTMPYSMDWAQRLFRRLPKKRPEDLLRSKSYSNPAFLRLFFDWLDEQIYHDPREGLRWAKVAPELASRAPASSQGRQAHSDLTVEAFALLGSAYRACGDFDASDAAYTKALQIPADSVSDLVRAETDHRLSYLRACQDRNDEALELASAAQETLREVVAHALLKLGQALISKGYVLADKLGSYEEAIDLFAEALAIAGDTKSHADQRLHASACHNLALAISESSSLGDQSKALKYVHQAQQLVKGQKRSLARYRLLWVEGLIWCKTGSHARAEKLFRMALEGFQALKLPWEIALVGLDLAALLHLSGRWPELEDIASETYQRFRLLAADTKAIAALSLWNDAVKARTWDEEKLAQARQIIVAGVAAGRGHKRGKP